MFAIIGLIILFSCVIGGYLLEGGNLHVLFQPVELLIIGGAAVGAFFITATPRVFSMVLKSMFAVFSPKSPSKKKYLDILALLFQIFSRIRKEGLLFIESHIENPEESSIFTSFPSVSRDHHMLNFICDNLKVIVTTANMPPHELENLIDIEIETHHHQALIPSHSIAKIADALPALGIVAAVLGVVITMGKISEPPEVLGHSIGAALVGTFLGVLLSYGVVGPIAGNLEHQAEEGGVAFQLVKIALVAFTGGAAPSMSVEFARRAIPDKEKPSFVELERHVRGGDK